MGQKQNTALLLALLTGVVLLVRLVFFLVYDTDERYSDLGPDGWLHTARNVVNGGGYSWPDADIPTAKRGPTVVYLFAAILWLFGEKVWVIVAVQWLADAGTCVLLFFIALDVFKDRRVAFLSSLLFAFYGPGLFLTIRAWSEPVFTLILAGFTLSLMRALHHKSIWCFALSGALLGLATLTRPIMQFYPVVVAGFTLWFLSRQWRKALSVYLAFLITFILVLLPWVIRNYQVFGAVIPGSTHSGVVNHQSHYALGEPDFLRYRTADEARAVLLEVLKSRFGPAPDISGFNAYLRTKDLNEYQAEQVAQQEALKAIRAYPGRYVVLSLWRFFRLWFNLGFGASPSLESYLVAINNSILLGLAAAALLFFRGTWLKAAVPLLALIAYSTAGHMAVMAVARFSAPIAPYVMVFAARTVVGLIPTTSRLWSVAWD